jgi:hypothetical protein
MVIEYSRIQHLHDPTNPQPAELQTFEAIFLDPAFFPTQTGDGEIIFQYYRIVNDDLWHDYATTGIEDYGHTSGLEYTFANIYPAAAAVLADGRAIKFTTDQPDPFPGVKEINNTPGGKIGLTVHPNPSRNRVVFSKGQSAKGIELKIYDITGRLINSFTLGPMPSALCWSVIDQGGRVVTPGVYFAALTAGRETMVIKLIVIE